MEGGWFKNVRVLLVLNEEEIQAEIGGLMLLPNANRMNFKVSLSPDLDL